MSGTVVTGPFAMGEWLPAMIHNAHWYPTTVLLCLQFSFCLVGQSNFSGPKSNIQTAK